MKRLTAVAFGLMAAFAMLTAPVTVVAAPIVFEFQGTITLIIGSINAQLGITTTDTLAGSYAFNPATVDSFPADPLLGVYENALTSLTVTIGGNTWTLGAFDFIQVSDNFIGADTYQVVADILSGPTVSGTSANFNVILFDATQSAFSSDALLLDPPDLSQFTVRLWQLRFGENDFISGELTGLTRLSQVPEPATLTLLGAGLAGLLTLHRRRRKASASLGPRFFRMNVGKR